LADFFAHVLADTSDGVAIRLADILRNSVVA
jgi:hypothetical protein